MLGGSCSACCGGWYCYKSCSEFSCVDATTASVTLDAADFLANAIYKYTPIDVFSGLSTYWEKETLFFKGSEISGTHGLQKRSDLSNSSQVVWESSASFWASCPTGGSQQISRRNIRLTLYAGSPASWVLSVPIVKFAWYTADRFSSIPSATGFKSASDFLCASLCSRCFTFGSQNDLLASCNTAGDVISLFRYGYESVPGYPVNYYVGFSQGGDSAYSRSLEYSSGPLSTYFFVNEVSIG